MKKFLIRTAQFTGILILLLFLSAFVWANWNAPSPGEQASIVDFVQYDATQIGDAAQIAKVQSDLKKMDGVNITTYNPSSQLLVISYSIDQTDRQTIESGINKLYHIHLHEKNFTQTGPKCPINVAYITRVKHFLCVRD